MAAPCDVAVRTVEVYDPRFMNAAERNRLVGLLSQGDSAALQWLLVSYHTQLHRAIAKSADPDLAAWVDTEDVLQEAYIAVFRHVDGSAFDGPAHFYKWVEQIALNKLRDAQRGLRRRKRAVWRRVPQPDHSGTYVDGVLRLVADAPTPSWLHRRREATAAVMTCLARLDEDQRRVIRMRFFEGSPVKEIAERLGRSEAAIYGLYGRGLKRLRELLGPLTDYLSTQ